MATYSNVPAVSSEVYSVNRQDVSAAPWTFISGAPYISYLVLYTCPANSYAIIKCGVNIAGQTQTNGTPNARVGLTVLNPNSFQALTATFARIKVNDATTFCYASNFLGERSEDKAENIYIGPGQTVYAVAAGPNTNQPVGTFEFHFSGVQFTNGL